VSAAPKRSIREHPTARHITRHEVLQLLDNAAREGDEHKGRDEHEGVMYAGQRDGRPQLAPVNN